MTYYIKNGGRYDAVSENNLNIEKILPSGTYTINIDPNTGQFYFQVIESFKMPPKLYGDTVKTAGRIMNTFLDRPSGTGVLLSGEKGSGKTLLAKYLSYSGINDHDIVTILINMPLRGEGFNQFIQSITQPAIIIFDEFEKVYDEEQQGQVLTLLDGTYPSKKLFIMTTNERGRISEYMINRPGRFFYLLKYTGLDGQFIREYCEDNLNDKDQINSVIRLASTFRAFNFDMLKAAVEEMNRYNEKIADVIKYVNIETDNYGQHYEVQTFSQTHKAVPEFIHENKVPYKFSEQVSGGQRINMTQAIHLTWAVDDNLLEKWYDIYPNEDYSGHIFFNFSDIVQFEPEFITYENEYGRVTIVKKEPETFDYSKFLL